MNTKNEVNYVIFDLFGTLIRFGVQHHPFRQLLKLARENGRKVRTDDARIVMTINGGIEFIGYGLDISPSDELVHKLEYQIGDELTSLTLFDDVTLTLNGLLARGIEIGVCSNLAQPYGAVIDSLLPQFRLEKFLSYELGAIKPESEIYNAIFNRFSCTPQQCLFVGDTFEADYIGPKTQGMNALHLVRSESSNKNQINSLLDVLTYIDSARDAFS